ncbi:SDR family oxidoreductase [Sunxiuqinia rutila]|uniref:SDR family oxidoreductase n=1 Tax=Sunxiuqinia rutila TaxID=1397841 RepID=UPI003D363050
MKRNIIVTGGGQGIGKITVQELLNAGYGVTVFEVDDEALAELEAEMENENLLLLKVDVADESMVKSGIKFSEEFFGGIYGLMNNAVIHRNGPIADLSLEEWNRALAVNLTGPFLCAKYAAPALQKAKGTIINICSTRALQSEANTEAYSASKGGLLSLTHALAMSLSPDVRVNAISSGWVDVSGIKKKSELKPETLSPGDHLQHPAGRVGRPEDIARMVLFLLNPENDFITGQNFVVDGGMTRKMIYQ